MVLAVRCVIAQLYRGMIVTSARVTDMIPEKEARNRAIYHRYLAVERAVDLANEFEISVRRVNKLIRRYVNRGQM